MKKAWERNISAQHKAVPSELVLGKMMPKDKMGLLPVIVGVSGGWIPLSRMLYRKDRFAR